MSEPRVLRLHTGLYAATAIDRAVELYGKHATIARSEAAPYVQLTIESERAGRADKVAKELANYALGLTVQSQATTVGGPR